jgi:hypothetical protein
MLNGISGIALDTAGNLYIADFNNNRIRMVANGVITTVAGNGTGAYAGDGLAGRIGRRALSVRQCGRQRHNHLQPRTWCVLCFMRGAGGKSARGSRAFPHGGGVAANRGIPSSLAAWHTIMLGT